ncbi:c-type cytochrome [Permianibacter aggregans]|uniref:Cytochrome c-551 n=1 Tax=Permianibacter aggregans TaxID=1510150 RepID=A0A4V6PWS2_9GAMM|nr:c-type cytochrome [Permianibacter aggregans]QGX40434.1 c-type cytochrome [Permianibacter aggregans]TDQ49427.1 cytochrome c [Permianibacter aggregans]
MTVKTILTATIIAISLSSAPADASNGEELIKKHGCAACHAADKRLVGPSYKEMAAKYKVDDKTVEMLAGKVLSGGAGVWGQIPMPPHKGRVTEAEAKTAVKHMLSVK